MSPIGGPWDCDPFWRAAEPHPAVMPPFVIRVVTVEPVVRIRERAGGYEFVNYVPETEVLRATEAGYHGA